MFNLFNQQIDKIKETTENLEATYGKEISPETLMIQISLLEQVKGIIEDQLIILRKEAKSIEAMGESN
jgi:hypothetical protein